LDELKRKENVISTEAADGILVRRAVERPPYLSFSPLRSRSKAHSAKSPSPRAPPRCAKLIAVMTPIILAQNVGKTYRSGKLEVQALRNVSFSVDPGEFVAIVGPSGSGKSTLFYVLGGLTGATSGHVTIEGTDFAKLSDADRTRMRRARIGFIFQRFNLLPTLSALGNIEIAHDIANLGASSKTPLDRELLDHLSDILGIKGRLDHRPNELSGGEQQRVAIARALINRPSIVLADEPTGNLDTKNSDAVLKMLRDSSRELNQTVLMITHNPEAAQIADRILTMRDGELIAEAVGTRR
jgi:putative ABC transport system ATP-binding protein